MKSSQKNRMERGTALVTAIFAILLGTLIAVALYYHSMTAMKISTNNRDSTEALYVADAGINHAAKLIGRARKGLYSEILNAGDKRPDTGDELSVPPETGLWTSAESIPAGDRTAGGVDFGSGRYFVSVRNDTARGEKAKQDKNGILIVTSTGIGRNGATATVEVTISNYSIPIPGILSNGDAKFTNQLTVLGESGIIQINGTPTFVGLAKGACAEKEFYFSGPPVSLPDIKIGALCNTDPTEGTNLFFNQPPQTPPIIDVGKLRSEFKPWASFIFKDNGEIYPQTDGVERTLSLSNIELTSLGLDGWVYNSSKKHWSHTADQRLPDGNYYFMNTNMSMTKGGDSIDPPKVTIFSEGHIKLNNQISLQPNFPGYALISANDIQMSSKYSTTVNPGFVYAYGQIAFSNTTYIVGSLIAADYYLPGGGRGPDALDPAGTNIVDRDQGAMQVSGGTTIVTSEFQNVVGSKIVGWREVRN